MTVGGDSLRQRPKCASSAETWRFFVFRETDYHFEYGGLDDIFDPIRRLYTCQCGGLGADRDKKSAAKKKI